MFSELPSQDFEKTDLVCPPLFPPLNGFLECSRPINSTENQGRLKITNLPGSNCILKCPKNFKIVGQYMKVCGKDGKWFGDGSGSCTSESNINQDFESLATIYLISEISLPELVCPLNTVTAELSPDSKNARIKIPVVKTDFNINQDITVKPSKLKTENGFVFLKKGLTKLTLTAKDPIHMNTKTCNVTVDVVGKIGLRTFNTETF